MRIKGGGGGRDLLHTADLIAEIEGDLEVEAGGGGRDLLHTADLIAGIKGDLEVAEGGDQGVGGNEGLEGAEALDRGVKASRQADILPSVPLAGIHAFIGK